MSPRLHVPAVSAGGPVIDLPPGEAHHARDVLRMRPGAEVRVFDGRGREWAARVVEVGRRRVTVERLAELAPVPEPPVQVTLALGILKPEYMEEALRNAAMVGVAAIAPLVTARAAVTLPERATRLVERWQRVVLASIKQCGRAVVPTVDVPLALDAWLASRRDDAGTRILLAEPAAQPTTGGVPAERPPFDHWRQRSASAGATVLVGPEGGWAPEEMARATAAGFAPWTVSPRILRADAAALAALSVLFYEWETENARR